MPKYLSLSSLSDGFIGDFCGLHYIFTEKTELLYKYASTCQNTNRKKEKDFYVKYWEQSKKSKMQKF